MRRTGVGNVEREGKDIVGGETGANTESGRMADADHSVLINKKINIIE